MAADSTRCQVMGDADLYGIGIRLAVYIQVTIYLVAASLVRSSKATLEIPALFSSFAITLVLLLRAFQRALRPLDTMLSLFVVGSLGAISPNMSLSPVSTQIGKPRHHGEYLFGLLEDVTRWLQLGLGGWAVFNDLKISVEGTNDCVVYIYAFCKTRNSGAALMTWKLAYALFIFVTICSSPVGTWAWQKLKRIQNVIVSMTRIFFTQASSSTSATVKSSYDTKADSAGRSHQRIENTKIADTHIPHGPSGKTATPISPLAAAHISPQTAQQYKEPVSGRKDGQAKATDTDPRVEAYLRRMSRRLIAVSGLYFLSFNVLGAELMIYWNDVQGVNELFASGQMMALLVGAFTLVQFWIQVGHLIGKRQKKMGFEHERT